MAIQTHTRTRTTVHVQCIIIRMESRTAMDNAAVARLLLRGLFIELP